MATEDDTRGAENMIHDFAHIRTFAEKLKVGLQVIDDAATELGKLPSGRCLADVVYEALPQDLEDARKKLWQIAAVLSRVEV